WPGLDWIRPGPRGRCRKVRQRNGLADLRSWLKTARRPDRCPVGSKLVRFPVAGLVVKVRLGSRAAVGASARPDLGVRASVLALGPTAGLIGLTEQLHAQDMRGLRCRTRPALENPTGRDLRDSPPCCRTPQLPTDRFL